MFWLVVDLTKQILTLRLLYTRKAQSKPENYKNKKRKQGKYKKRKPNSRLVTKERELRKEGTELLVVSPQTRDQSNRVPLNEARIWSPDLSKSSKVRWFCSFQRHYSMHNRTKFQIWDECFPNQFHQPKSKFGIDLGMTHDTPKVIKTKLHNR